MDRKRTSATVVALLLGLSGCAAGPKPIAIHDTPLAGVWLAVDSRAETGHRHPYVMTTDAMMKVLKGVRVEDRDTITGTGLLGSQYAKPSFSPGEIALLAPYLVEALKKASPKDLATFYMVVGDGSRRRAITSGGLFIDAQGRLRLMVANCRSAPAGGQDYTMAMELDSRDEPLLPITPFRFRIGFYPPEAWIQDAAGPNQPSFRAYGSVYTDPAKSIVIDLNRLLDEHSSPPQPMP